MKNFLKISVFIIVFLITGCKTAEDVLKTENYFKFYINYKEELFRTKGKSEVDVDSLQAIHKISSKDMKIVKEGVRKNPKIWYTFNQDLLKYLDSTIAIEDSIQKAKRDSIKMTKFRFREPELYRKARDLKRKNEKLIDEKYKRLGTKRPKKKRKTPPPRYEKGKTTIRSKKAENNSKTKG